MKCFVAFYWIGFIVCLCRKVFKWFLRPKVVQLFQKVEGALAE